MSYSFSSSSSAAAAAVAGGDGETLVDCAAMVCAIANAQKTDSRGWFLLCVATAFSSSPGSFLPSFVISFPLLPFSFRLLLWSWKKKTKKKQKKNRPAQSDFSPFFFSFKNVLKKKNQKKP
jgi:hypothetical protein